MSPQVLRALVVEDEPIARRHLRDMLAELSGIECVGEAGDGDTAVQMIADLRPDVVFLDIEMPGSNGLEVLQRIEHEPAVVFTTAYDKFAVAAFELDAIDYLLKPFGRDRLAAALKRLERAARDESAEHAQIAERDEPLAQRAAEALEHMETSGPLVRIFVRDRGRIVPVAVQDIERLEADDDYVAVYSRGRRYLVYLGMQEFEERLAPDRFLRVHRSHIVNLDHVAAMQRFDATRLQIEMKDGTKIVASRTRSRELRGLGV